MTQDSPQEAKCGQNTNFIIEFSTVVSLRPALVLRPLRLPLLLLRWGADADRPRAEAPTALALTAFAPGAALPLLLPLLLLLLPLLAASLDAASAAAAFFFEEKLSGSDTLSSRTLSSYRMAASTSDLKVPTWTCLPLARTRDTQRSSRLL